MKKLFALSLSTMMVMGLLVGCGGQNKAETEASKAPAAVEAQNSAALKDGTYEGQAVEQGSQYPSTVEVKLTVEAGKITQVEQVEKDSKGQVKDENYAKEAGEENYKKAQKAIEGAKTYGPALIEKQNVEQVDAVAGATVSNKLFKEAVNNALKAAK